jgi:glycosyltransferase involved in cell wall biosynthesis
MNSVAPRSRLAIVTTVHRWGDPRVFERNARAAVECGLEVHAFVPATGDPPLPQWAKEGDFHLHPLQMPQSRFERMRLALGVTKYVLKYGEFDAVHFHDPELIPAMVWLSLSHPGVRILYDVHEELPLEVFSKAYIPGPIRPLASGFARLLWGLGTWRFHAFAPATEAIAAHWPPERTRVVHNYPQGLFNLSRNGLEVNPNRIVFIGALTHIHGVEEVLQSVSKLRQENPQVRLELYGRLLDQPLQPAVDQAVREGWCQHTHWLEPAELITKLSGAGVGLVPYHPLRDHLDALPTKIFEYMALGIPILASDFPLWRRIIQDENVGLCAAPTVEGITQGLRLMMSDRARLQAWSVRAREIYQRQYRWEVEAENLRSLYRLMGLKV